jgi:hypothetical protein
MSDDRIENAHKVRLDRNHKGQIIVRSWNGMEWCIVQTLWSNTASSIFGHRIMLALDAWPVVVAIVPVEADDE